MNSTECSVRFFGAGGVQSKLPAALASEQSHCDTDSVANRFGGACHRDCRIEARPRAELCAPQSRTRNHRTAPASGRADELEVQFAAEGSATSHKDYRLQRLSWELSPPPAIEGRNIGGAAVLAAYVRAAAWLRERNFSASRWRHIGASPPASALNQDEPSVEFMGSILGPGCSRQGRAADFCHVVASLGNHEFDEGLAEFRRIVDGGDRRGPFLGHTYQGAPFVYIGANVHDKRTGKTVVNPTSLRTYPAFALG